MDELGIEAKHKIVRLLFPDLSYGGDPDIERYFDSRKAGQVGRALSIYNGALRVRYPDDASRIELLRLYRENDPRYSAYQENLLLEFASNLSIRIRRNIDLITAPLEKADLSDALRALKTVESILSRLPGEAEGAPDLLSRYYEFAQALDYRKVLARRALELVREYDAVSRADSPADYDFVARSAAIEERRRLAAGSRTAGARAEGGYDFVSRSAEFEARRKKSEKESTSYFDPSRIKFTEADKARVEISSALVRREDKVLAFCAKYWPHAQDLAFERTVFLYSRKYGGKHFEIFRAIRSGRTRGASDDEILSSVAAILTTSYSYSVSGDLYMQVMWRRLRARMEAQVVAKRLAAPGPESRVRTRRAAYAAGSSPDYKNPESPAPELSAPSVPPPPAGDEVPTRFLRRAGEHASPPAFALKEASKRAQAKATPSEPYLGLRVAKRTHSLPKPRATPVRPDSAQRAPPSATPLATPSAARPRSAAPTAQQRSDQPALQSRPAPPKALSTASPAPDTSGNSAKRIATASPSRPAATAKASKVAPQPGASKRRASAQELSAKSKSGGTSHAPTLRPVAKARGANPLGRNPVGPEPIREIRAKHGSISDSIRQLSGKTYDVYKVIFLEKVRGAIHKTLLANQTKSHGIFDTAANDAEDQVYGFIAEHYDDPFMDWEHSAEREVVESLGFSMPSLAPVIEACFKKL
jgi:hypothetical protein